MPHSHLPSEAFEPELARESLASLVEHVFASDLAPWPASGAALRVETPVKPVAARAWLNAQRETVRVYWSDRSGAFEAAGVGAADVVDGHGDDPWAPFARIETALTSGHPNLRYYGGLRFNLATTPSDAWRPFGASKFILPRFELLNTGQQSYLACNVLLGPDSDHEQVLEEILEAMGRLQFPDAPEFHESHFVRRRADYPDRPEWLRLIDEALDMMRSGDLEKIVLAREVEFLVEQGGASLAMLDQVLRRGEAVYGFLFQPCDGVAFMGASPERLYRRRGRYIESEAVAGTRPRGATPEADEALGLELMASEKDVREHQFVVDALHSGFASLCGTVQGHEQLSLLRVPQCQHLFRRIEGILTEPYADAAILGTIHPTPAVGGFPTRAAIEHIERMEPFDRGWYAGPVGWIGPDAAEFAVAIRCALAHGPALSVYSGAGIVRGSEPESEWEEIENKMTSFSNAIHSVDAGPHEL